MNNIKDLTSKVTSSSSAESEEQAVEALWTYIGENRIYVQIFSVDADKNIMDINEVSDLGDVKKIEVELSSGEESYRFEWDPIELDNVFILFREK